MTVVSGHVSGGVFALSGWKAAWAGWPVSVGAATMGAVVSAVGLSSPPSSAPAVGMLRLIGGKAANIIIRKLTAKFFLVFIGCLSLWLRRAFDEMIQIELFVVDA